MQGDRITGLLGEPFVEDLHGLAELAQVAVRQRQEPARFPMLRPEGDHLRVARCCFLGSSQAIEQDAQVGVRVDVAGVQSNCGAIRSFGFRRPSCRPEQHPEIAVGIRVPGVEGDRTAVGVHGCFQLAVRLQDDAQVAVPVRLIRAQGEAALDERDRVFRLPLLMGKDARVVQRPGMIGGHVEHAPIQLSGRQEVTVPLQLDGECDRLFDRQLARRRLRLLHGRPKRFCSSPVRRRRRRPSRSCWS